jgi:glutathione peroxidase
MLRLLLLSVFLVAGTGVTNVYDFKVPNLDGKTTIDLSKYKGKKIMIVNTASEFCTKNYGVTFPMAEKVDVVGDNIHPLFKYLTEEAKKLGVADPVIGWNFTKFLLDENGKLIAVFPSKVKPTDDQVTKYLN